MTRATRTLLFIAGSVLVAVFALRYLMKPKPAAIPVRAPMPVSPVQTQVNRVTGAAGGAVAGGVANVIGAFSNGIVSSIDTLFGNSSANTETFPVDTVTAADPQFSDVFTI